MIEPGSAQKYLLYAIGEILLVMIGILLALQVNNWNELRQTKESTKTYLHGIIEDLKDDLATLKRMEEYHMFRFYALNYILKVSGISEEVRDIPEWTPNRYWNKSIPENYDREFLSLSFAWIHRTGALEDYNSFSIEEMNNIGLYSFIESRPLKTSLNRYYKNWDWRLGSEQLQKEHIWIERMYEVLAQDGIYHISLRNMEDPLSHISEYPYRGVILKRITGLAGWRYTCSIILQEEAKGLISQIEEEIEKY